jgi:hypothetical protein
LTTIFVVIDTQESGWRHVLWDDAMISSAMLHPAILPAGLLPEGRTFKFANREAFIAASNWGEKSDILRYDILMQVARGLIFIVLYLFRYVLLIEYLFFDCSFPYIQQLSICH